VKRTSESRTIAAAIRCYPTSWRSRHGDEAMVVASALLDEGTTWWSIVGSFLGGAARERLLRRPSWRFGSALAAILFGIAAGPLALFASLTPASASGTTVTIMISKPDDAVRQLESAFAADHITMTIYEKSVPPDVVGSILSVSSIGSSSGNDIVLSEIHGRCNDGSPRCVVGLEIPLNFAGTIQVTVGEATTSKDVHHLQRKTVTRPQ